MHSLGKQNLNGRLENSLSGHRRTRLTRRFAGTW